MLELDEKLLSSCDINCFIQASIHEQAVEYMPYGVLIDDSFVRPVSPDSIFQIGSVSKLLTACIVVSLSKKGLVDLHSRYYFFNSLELRGFSLHELLLHRSGIIGPSGYPGVENISLSAQLLSPLLTELSEYYSPKHQSVYHYCGINYRAIQRILEENVEASFEDLLWEFICKPLGLSQTTTSLSKFDRQFWIKGSDENGMYLPGGFNLFTDCEAAAGIWSSASDLSKLMIALLKSEKEIDQSSFNITWRDLINTRTSGHYRFGCILDNNFPLKLGHSGRNPGFQSRFWFNPRNRAGVVLLWNNDKPNPLIDSSIVKHL